jgi:hypothetical protein
MQAEDTYLWFRLVQVGCPVAWVKEMVFKQRLHGDNSVHNIAHVKQGKTAMLETIFTDPQNSSLLGMNKESAYARAYMGFASLEYAGDYIDDAQSDLSQAVKFDPTLLADDADRLLESIAAYAWNHLTGDPITFTNRVFSNLPEELINLRNLRRKAIARTWIVGAFRAYQYNDMAGVRRYTLKAIATAPASLLNRGLISILIQSLTTSDRLSGTRSSENLGYFST